MRGEERETDTASLESLSEVLGIQSLCRSVPRECCWGGGGETHPQTTLQPIVLFILT